MCSPTRLKGTWFRYIWRYYHLANTATNDHSWYVKLSLLNCIYRMAPAHVVGAWSVRRLNWMYHHLSLTFPHCFKTEFLINQGKWPQNLKQFFSALTSKEKNKIVRSTSLRQWQEAHRCCGHFWCHKEVMMTTRENAVYYAVYYQEAVRARMWGFIRANTHCIG